MASGFTTIIRTQSCIDSLPFHSSTKSILSNFYKNFNKLYNESWDSSLPLTCKVGSPEFKLRRQFKHDPFIENIESEFPNHTVIRTQRGFKVLDGKKFVLKILDGEGSRNNKAGGGRSGIMFEKELSESLRGNSNKHKSIVDSIHKILCEHKMNTDSLFVNHVGGMNKKRNPEFNGSRVCVSSDIGTTVGDIVVSDGLKSVNLSLKWSSAFYLTNMSIRKYLNDKNIDSDDKIRNELVKSLGFVPYEFFKGYGVYSTDKVGLDRETLVLNWTLLIQEILGYGYVYIVAGGKYDTIIDLKEPCKVEVLSIGYPVYAIPGVRKYSKIDLTVLINGKTYNLECQLRGTEATDTLPYYLRLVAR